MGMAYGLIDNPRCRTRPIKTRKGHRGKWTCISEKTGKVIKGRVKGSSWRGRPPGKKDGIWTKAEWKAIRKELKASGDW